MGENALANEFGVQASHKGFYSEVDIEDALDKEDYSKRFECSGENEDDFIYSSATYLLEGECGSFALALQDTFGYLPYVVKSKKGKSFHAFCQVEKDGKLYYIDARGVTTDFDEFMLTAKKFISGEYIARPATKKEMENWKDGIFYERAFLFSKALIRDHREYYEV